MGVYVYTVKTKHVKTNIGNVHLHKFAYKTGGGYDYNTGRSYNDMNAQRKVDPVVRAWDKRDYRPLFIVDQLKEGEPVYVNIRNGKTGQVAYYDTYGVSDLPIYGCLVKNGRNWEVAQFCPVRWVEYPQNYGPASVEQSRSWNDYE